MRSRCGSATPICRKARARAAAAPPQPWFRRRCGRAEAEGRDRAERQRKPVPGSNAPWREMLAASPDLSAVSVRPDDSKPTAPGVRSPLEEAGFMGIIFGWMLRRFANLAVGAGVPSSVQVIEVEVDTWLGHVRVLTCIPALRSARSPRRRWRAARPRARSSRASAMRCMKRARPMRAAATCSAAGLEDYRIPGIRRHAGDRRAFRRSRLRSRARRQRRHRRGRDGADLAGGRQRLHNATGARLTEIPIRPDR